MADTSVRSDLGPLYAHNESLIWFVLASLLNISPTCWESSLALFVSIAPLFGNLHRIQELLGA